MPQRDEQEYEAKRQRIIDGALDVFSSKGFEKATNKDIADAAQIGSPALIYHYFKDKADLLRHVVEQRTPVLQLLQDAALLDLPPEQALARFGEAFVQMTSNRAAVKLIKLIIGEAIRRPQVAEMVNQIGPGRIFSVLSRYMERQMNAGTLRRMDPGAAARCFAGPLVAFLLTREVFAQPDAPSLSAETMVRTSVEIFLRGMLIE